MSHRDDVVDTARGEAALRNQPPDKFGFVSSAQKFLLPGGIRGGWGRLEKYFTDLNLSVTDESSFQNPARLPNGKDWCGIFAAWCLNVAGFSDVGWNLNGGMMTGQSIEKRNFWTGNYPPPNKRTAINLDLDIGDVCILTGSDSHHVLIADIKDDGRSFWAVGGNENYQQVWEHQTTTPFSNVVAAYKVITEPREWHLKLSDYEQQVLGSTWFVTFSSGQFDWLYNFSVDTDNYGALSYSSMDEDQTGSGTWCVVVYGGKRAVEVDWPDSGTSEIWPLPFNLIAGSITCSSLSGYGDFQASLVNTTSE